MGRSDDHRLIPSQLGRNASRYYASNVVGEMQESVQEEMLVKLEANLGYVYENLMAQMLAASRNKLFYYTFPKDEKHSYEIDFLLSRGNKICPIEVKSSGYKTHTSLDVFCLKFSNRIKDKFLVYTKDFSQSQDVLYIPFYMIPVISEG